VRRLAPGRPRLIAAFLAVLFLSACAALGKILTTLATERPPLPLERAEISSDARLDSAGRIAGSFVGEGTSRQVHLLSSDTGLIAGLVERYRPERARRVDPLTWLDRRRNYAIDLDPARDSLLLGETTLAGSPNGHTRAKLRTILLHASHCRGGTPQAELIVEPLRRSGPSLRGPAVGSLRAPSRYWPAEETYWRDPPAEPSPWLVDTLLARTAFELDSLLARRLAARDLPLQRIAGRIVVNTLEDEDAADVVPFRLGDGRVRFAVSLRERRRTARGRDVLAAIVMVWDSTLTWRQVVFQPTLLEYGRRGPARALGGRTAPLFWRRFEALSGFADHRDYLWLEQVDVSDRSVLWVILEPHSNTVVAAAEVEDGC
jgi:hypothetical protein